MDLPGPTFERDLDVLSHVGVALPPPQESLLYDLSTGQPMYGTSGYAMVAWPLPDPRSGEPMLCRDRDTGLLRTVTVPAPIALDHTAWAQMHDAGAQRFPSLAGRLIVPSIWGRTAGDVVELDPAPVRLWDCWPINEADSVDLFYVLMDVLRRPPYFPMAQIARLHAGADDPCEVVPEDWGRHEHVYAYGWVDESGPHGHFECVSAKRYVEEWEALIYPEDQEPGEMVPWAFEPLLELRWPLSEHWAQLQASGRRNATRAIESYPVHQREDVALTERTFSPWLSS